MSMQGIQGKSRKYGGIPITAGYLRGILAIGIGSDTEFYLFFL
jgi:hypothetical protein